MASADAAGWHAGPLHGLWVHEPATHGDERGFFRESFRLSGLEAALGYQPTFVQANHSRSRRGVLRGLHAEGWEKLVYVVHGEVVTALADIRPDSPTFGQVATFQLSDRQPTVLFIPVGLAHGYVVLSDEADYTYQATRYYDGTDTRAVAWDDPDLAIAWPLAQPLLSERDRHNPTLRDLFPERFDLATTRTPRSG